MPRSVIVVQHRTGMMERTLYAQAYIERYARKPRLDALGLARNGFNAPSSHDNCGEPMTGDKVVLATFGTHGDVHPFMALALALQRCGLQPTIAAAETYRAKIEVAGIAFHCLRPDLDDVCARLGMDQRQLARAIAAKPEFLLQKIVLPSLRETFDDAMAVMRDADIAITSSVAYGARLAAEKCAVAHFGVVLQPFVLFSASDPPVVANWPRLSTWVYARGEVWTRAFLALGKRVARPWAKPIDALRRDIGLSPATRHPLFEGQFDGSAGTLAMFSPLFGAPQPDHPPNIAIVGFAFYDSDDGKPPALTHELRAFLDAGPPPIIFTQGTSAVHDADDFVHESLAAVAELGVRAVFVLNDAQVEAWSSQASESVLFTAYAPYSLLFPRALVNVHHGGVGTTAQALRSGRPQLISPYLVDQPDNAARVVRLGVGCALAPKNYRRVRVAEALRTLISDAGCGRCAADVGAQIASEDGAAAAADIVAAYYSEQRLAHSRQHHDD